MSEKTSKKKPHPRTGRTHPARDVQSFDDPRVDDLLDTLRARRIALKKTQKEIADLSSCSLRAVIFMENHQHMPSLSQFIRYASALDYLVVLTEARA